MTNKDDEEAQKRHEDDKHHIRADKSELEIEANAAVKGQVNEKALT